MSINKYLMPFFIKSIDPINKEYFHDNPPRILYAGWAVLFLTWSACLFMSICKDGFLESIKNSTLIFFLICLMPALLFAYKFYILLFYKKAPKDSLARIAWLKEKEKTKERRSRIYKKTLAPIVEPISTLIGYVFIIAIAIVAGGVCINVFSSFSVHTLLIIIIALLIFK